VEPGRRGGGAPRPHACAYARTAARPRPSGADATIRPGTDSFPWRTRAASAHVAPHAHSLSRGWLDMALQARRSRRSQGRPGRCPRTPACPGAAPADRDAAPGRAEPFDAALLGRLPAEPSILHVGDLAAEEGTVTLLEAPAYMGGRVPLVLIWRSFDQRPPRDRDAVIERGLRLGAGRRERARMFAAPSGLPRHEAGHERARAHRRQSLAP